MNLKKSLALLGTAFLAAACGLDGFHSVFYSDGPFKDLSAQSFLEAAQDSVVVLDGPFLASSSLAYTNATVNADKRAAKAGFLLSMQKDKHLAAGYVPKPYASYNSGTGGDKSMIFAVYADTPGSVRQAGVTFVDKDYGTASMVGLSYNNTAEIVNLVTYGSETIPPFRQGDWLQLTIYCGSVEKVVDLASYDTELKVVNEWKKLEISDMKDFDHIDFKVTSNRSDIPLNVCLDHICAYVEISR